MLITGGIIKRKAISPHYEREKLGSNEADLARLNKPEKDSQYQTDPV